MLKLLLCRAFYDSTNSIYPWTRTLELVFLAQYFTIVWYILCHSFHCFPDQSILIIYMYPVACQSSVFLSPLSSFTAEQSCSGDVMLLHLIIQYHKNPVSKGNRRHVVEVVHFSLHKEKGGGDSAAVSSVLFNGHSAPATEDGIVCPLLVTSGWRR